MNINIGNFKLVPHTICTCKIPQMFLFPEILFELSKNHVNIYLQGNINIHGDSVSHRPMLVGPQTLWPIY